MCGICGYLHLDDHRRTATATLAAMTDALIHRGPDSYGYYQDAHIGLGARRLSIIDVAHGHQPIYNEDRSIVMVCNGEIFNFHALRAELCAKGHVFRTHCDIEVLVHLYEEYGVDCISRINGQFAFALYDEKQRRLFLARDHVGINPLYYTIVENTFIFGSEIKAILEHPLVPRAVDLVSLDQMMTFPGLVSPRTMFKGINSLKSGHFILIDDADIQIKEYWDLDYPRVGEVEQRADEALYLEQLNDLLLRSVRYRLQSDVPLGFYLSGGLDSSLIAGLINEVYQGNDLHSFSIVFDDPEIDESKYQRLMQSRVRSTHHPISFDWQQMSETLRRVIYHSESPLKETYNAASITLSQAARRENVTVILTGEGSDELFAGYVGYRFDQLGRSAPRDEFDIEALLESEMRSRLWGSRDFFYEKDYYSFINVRRSLYSDALNQHFDSFNCYNFDLIDQQKIVGRHPLHIRSYLDFKLRMTDHLLTDHGDRMALANSVEARYPFLDIDVINFVRTIPPELKLKDATEKYILKRVAERRLPPEIMRREKFAFVAPGSPYLLKQEIEWIDDLLSFDRIKREGYFNPHVVERLRRQYREKDFRLNLPFDTDLLIMVITFGLFREIFQLPCLN